MQRPELCFPLLLSAALAACVPQAADPPAQGEESSDSGAECTPGYLGCECNDGLCLGELECVADVCMAPDECMSGSEGCACAEGNLCLGGLECIDGICGEPGEEGCTPMAYFRCADGDVYWFDSCDNQGEVKEDCDPEFHNCVNMSDEEAYCVPIGDDCDNGMIDPGEDCEVGDLDGQTCASLGYAEGGQLGCTDWCTFDESGCETCGNGVVDDPSEDCDGTDFQNASCQSFDYDDGEIACTSSCSFDLSDCFDCECNGGVCCENNCNFASANLECDPQASTEYGCPGGTAPGSDVSSRSRAQYCSGDSASCSGDFGPWSPWQTHDSCDWDEYCEPGQSSCSNCSFSFDVTQYECSSFSSANGAGPGGGEIFRVCSSTNSQTGYMTVKARKMDGSNFGNRPYQVRVSAANNDPCGPNAWFFVVSDSDPVGVGTNELTFSFPAQWEPQQWEKSYCVTASTQFGDPGYDPNNAQQQSWWYSKKSSTSRTCN